MQGARRRANLSDWSRLLHAGLLTGHTPPASLRSHALSVCQCQLLGLVLDEHALSLTANICAGDRGMAWSNAAVPAMASEGREWLASTCWSHAVVSGISGLETESAAGMLSLKLQLNEEEE